jgi:hypothetical protein
MKTITAYKCSYCKKVYQIKVLCEKHEPICYSNPITRSCAGCAYLKSELANGTADGCFDSPICRRGLDISKQLKTGCFKFLPKQLTKGMKLISFELPEID